jgi:VCBS repeat-containing protein
VSDIASGSVVVGQRIAGRYGHLWLSANGSYTYTADISTAINSAATGSHLQDDFSYTASDGNGSSSNAATLDITLDRPPLVTASNVALPPSNIVAASSLFSVGNPDSDGDPITQYSFYDGASTASSGEFLLNGAAQPMGTNQPLVVGAAQLSQVTFQTGTGAGDDLYITAYAGSAASNVGHIQVSLTAPPPPPSGPPSISFNDQTVAPSQSVPLTSIFSASGGGITEYEVWFSHPEGGNPALGTVTNNGIPIALDQPVTVANLNGLNYIGSSTRAPNSG